MFFVKTEGQVEIERVVNVSCLSYEVWRIDSQIREAVGFYPQIWRTKLGVVNFILLLTECCQQMKGRLIRDAVS